MRIVSVIGARPQFIKCSPVSRCIRQKHEEILVHTGQHYNDNMSTIFFRDLGIPDPDYNLEIGSGSHAQQTGGMLTGIEKILVDTNPDCVLVYGDTNSTLAGALAASKLHLPVAHVEAGLRSYDRTMPEEINRIVADHVADLLFCPTEVAVDNLTREGIHKGVYTTGDVMVDSLYYARDHQKLTKFALSDLNLKSGEYLIATIHRASNTDNLGNLKAILHSLSELPYPVIFPVHPRTRKIIQQNGLDSDLGSGLRMTDPVSYTVMLSLISHAKAVLTDSGGIQKEAYILKIPCITLRDTTEWVETVQDGWNQLTGADPALIKKAVIDLETRKPNAHTAVYGDGHASERIVSILETSYLG